MTSLEQLKNAQLSMPVWLQLASSDLQLASKQETAAEHCIGIGVAPKSQLPPLPPVEVPAVPEVEPPAEVLPPATVEPPTEVPPPAEVLPPAVELLPAVLELVPAVLEAVPAELELVPALAPLSSLLELPQAETATQMTTPLNIPNLIKFMAHPG